MHVISGLGNIGLRQHAGIELRAIPLRAYVPVKATIVEQILSGCSVLAADWTICLDNEKTSILSRLTKPVLSPRLVISIGFQADGRDQLVRDAHLWLETWPTVARTVLVTIVEEPRYSCPISLDALEYADLPPRHVFENFLYPDGERKAILPVSGPVEFAGHRWTGRFAHVWRETWLRRDTPSGSQPMLEEGSQQVC
jgi:hypothetical protein